jgi:hypothetical protein
MEAPCGFQWKGGHIHECVFLGEHDENNRDHVCYCGDFMECRREERSYEPPAKWPLMNAVDDEIPF